MTLMLTIYIMIIIDMRFEGYFCCDGHVVGDCCVGCWGLTFFDYCLFVGGVVGGVGVADGVEMCGLVSWLVGFGGVVAVLGYGHTCWWPTYTSCISMKSIF